jgi:hypothetical protein
MPIAVWAKSERSRPTKDQAEQPAAADDLRELMAGLAVPEHVAGITYARGCRIRRVRVLASDQKASGRSAKQLLIVSRRALNEARS